MSRRLCAMMLSVMLLLGLLALPAGAGDLSNFRKSAAYGGQFADVPSGAWYEANVKEAFELGLLGGKSAARFDPTAHLTLGEAAKLAVCISSLYETGKAVFPAAIPWYLPYVQYLQARGLVPFQVPDWTAKATRAQFAALLAVSLPEQALPERNALEDGVIPDVASSATYYDAVYLLYRAGILTGSDSRGSFRPSSNIQRSEVAAIVTRMAIPAQRKTLKLDKALTAQALFALCAPAVAYVEVFDAAGQILGTGSGFFISEGGKLVTNCHVIEGATTATVKTTDGKIHKVTGAYGADPAIDLALLQVEGGGYAYLVQGDSKNLATGQMTYAIGSPLGLENSLSTGIVSSPSRTMGGGTYIQTTAAISPGSSGGALLDEVGRVIGVTSGTLSNGQSLNFAVPIHLLAQLKTAAAPQPLGSMQTKIPVGLSVTPASVTLAAGKSTTVHFTVTDPSGLAATCEASVGDARMVSYQFGDWYDVDIPLTLSGLRAGTTTVTLDLFDENGKNLASKALTVTVTGSAVQPVGQTYPGRAPAPDFGLFSDTPLYEKSVGPDDELYLYRISDLKVSPEQAVSGYFTQLGRSGFVFTEQFDDDAGNPVSVFQNAAANVTVAYGTTVFRGVSCISIMLTAV